ncbi:MAG: response regulator transcription factor [Steroidobacteraceae bacterium]|nr:response regulator transcription factor [Steroidobacteraceae bacterium]
MSTQSDSMRVLVVDDSERVRKTLATGLRARGMAVETAADGAEALVLLNGLPFDVAVLDLMMPRVDGMQVLEALRGRRVRPRVLVLSARDQVQDRVDALNLGADDYLVKPFSFDELLARLLALSRRSFAETSPELACGRLHVDSARQLVRVDDTVLTLTPKEYALLELLVRRKGHVLGRAVIFEQLYESDSTASDTVIEVLISTLRAKLARAGLSELIETRRGFGYVVA